MLSKIFGATNTMQAQPSGGLMQGDHSIHSNQVMGVSHNAITPTNATHFRQVESAPAVREARYIKPGEAAALKQMAKTRAKQAKSSEQAYRQLSSIQRSDARVQRAHRQYVGNAAHAALNKKQADVALANRLHGMRLPYAQLGTSHQQAEQQANQNVAGFMQIVRNAM